MDIELLKDSKDPYTSRVFRYISKNSSKRTIMGDDTTPIYTLPLSACSELSDIMHDEVQSRLGTFQSLDEARGEVVQRIAGDTLYNTATNIGTFTDPSLYTHSTVPISITPVEETNLYASGGLPADIIDKKSRAMCVDGLGFKSNDTKFWNNDRTQALEERAEYTGLNDVLGDAISDCMVYGGSALFPFYKDDTPSGMMKREGSGKKDNIERWCSIDRWNILTVPSYIPTQQDYINPKSIYITTSCLELSTERCAMLRPKALPYWAVILNLGWSPSDFASWLRAYFGYAITMQSIPVMAQQSSLLLYKMPLDALQATIGANEVEKLMAINEKKMSEWSVTNPKAVNMVGDVEVVNRTYSGFDNFIGAMKSHLSAECGLPEPSLWHTPNKGFSDNTTESLLKQSEKLRLLQKNIERSLGNVKRILVGDVFGWESEEYKKLDNLTITLNRPIVTTEKDRAEIGARFAASVSSFVMSGITPDTAIELSKPFFPSIKITDKLVADIKESYEKQQEAQQQAGFNNGLGGKSNSGLKTQAVNTGHYTKGGKA